MSVVKFLSAGADDEKQKTKLLKERGEANLMNARLVEETVKNRRWWCFAHALVKLHTVTRKFAELASTCPCHEVFDKLNDEDKRAFYKEQKESGADRSMDGPLLTCPCGGLRCVDFAFGRWKRFFKELYGLAEQELLLLCVGLDDEGVAFVLSALECGKNTIFCELELKLFFRDHLLWRFAACMHFDAEIARWAMGVCVAKFAESP